ncbi:hypothetical protein CEXT_141141 [Caerostris extrusa]|uniref:Uncharacterized protein n=1 Tax=Caerostris extrusa TaxID=172846 RepID=A0AAV4SCT2_CAEEX|nr:hypothetical protein CEXT_141141 [Caerostris extrusa]
MRLQLSSDMLVLQKEEMVPIGLPSTPANPAISLDNNDAQHGAINFHGKSYHFLMILLSGPFLRLGTMLNAVDDA